MTVNWVVELVEEGLSKKAQMPPQMMAADTRVVGTALIMKEFGMGPGLGSTVVLAANAPVPLNTDTMVFATGMAVPLGTKMVVPDELIVVLATS